MPIVGSIREPFTGFFAGTAVFLALALSACGDGDGGMGPRDTRATAEAPFSYHFPAAQQTRLTLAGINGSIGVTTGSPFVVEGERRVGSFSQADAQANLDRLEVIATDLGDEIRIETRQPDHDSARTYTVDYRLTVPDGIALDLANVNGSVVVALRNGSGAIAVVNGAIQAELAVPSDGALALSTINGSIDLGVPTATSATLSANVVNGAIAVQGLPMQVTMSTGTRLQGTLGAGEATIAASTVNGSIVIRGI